MRDRGRTYSRIATSLLALGLFIVTAPATVFAATDPIAAGSSVLRLEAGFFIELANNRIETVSANGGTVRQRRIVTLGVSGGAMDPTTGLGTVEGIGGFRLRRGREEVTIARLRVETRRRLVRASIDGRTMKLGRLSPISETRDGFGVVLFARRLSLSGAAARRISNRLALIGSRRLSKKQVIASLRVSTQPETVTVPAQGSAAFLPGSMTTFANLSSKGIDPYANITATPPATLHRVTRMPGFDLEFPSTGGSIAADGSAGTLNLTGGMRIDKPDGPAVEFVNLRLDFGERVVYADSIVNGVMVSRSEVIANGPNLEVYPEMRIFQVYGGPFPMTATVAALLNREFPGGQDFAAGDVLGAIWFIVEGQ